VVRHGIARGERRYEVRSMSTRRTIFALLIAFTLSACGATTPSGGPSASTAVVASPTAAAAASPSSSPDATAAPTPTPEPTATPAPTPVPTPVPWKAYTSKRNKYTVKYPPDWVVTPGSAKFADQIDDYGMHYVYLSRDTVKGTASLNLTVSHAIATMKSHYKAKLLSNKKVKVGSWPGKLLTFNGTDSGRSIYIQELILTKGKAAYFIDMFSDRGHATADKALFKRIYKTFKPKS
jgi:hypothetical protein